MWLNTILNALTRAAKWAFKNPRLFAEVALVAALVAGGWMYNRQQEALDEARKTHVDAKALADNLRQKITIKDGQIEVLRREKGKVVYKKVYVPPEGSVIITEEEVSERDRKYRELWAKYEDARRRIEAGETDVDLPAMPGPPKPPGSTITVHDWGFGFWPGYGLEWGNRGIQPQLDGKFFFWKRYSAFAGGSQHGIGVGVSRHVDDIIWTHPRNVEVFGKYLPLTFNGGQQWAVGIRTNF